MPNGISDTKGPGLGLDFSARQEQRLTLQQRQALALLQMSQMELAQAVQKELDENVLLEEYNPENEKSETERQSEEYSADTEDLEEKARREGLSEGEERLEIAGDSERALDSLQEGDSEWEDYYSGDENYGNAAGSDVKDLEERHEFALNSASRESTLLDELMQQFALDLDESYRPVYEYLLGSLDEKGFLTEIPKEMAGNLKVPVEMVEKCLGLLKGYEPAGLGAANVKECLLIQLEKRGQKDSLGWKIISRFCDELFAGQLSGIFRTFKIGMEELKEALSGLDPCPGRELQHDVAAGIRPDVIVKEDENGDFLVELARGVIPGVRISKTNRDLLKNSGRKADREYLKDRLKDATGFLASLEYCKSTILRVAEALVAHQEDFLRHGEGHMQPLTMHQLAEELMLSDSTISRTMAQKYMDTPQGLMKMKDFTSRPAIKTAEAEVSGSDARSLLKELVDSEDKSHPLGDEELSAKMAERGCPIARRTVVKYRESLGIPKAGLRRNLQ